MDTESTIQITQSPLPPSKKMFAKKNIYYIPLFLIILLIGLLHSYTPGEQVFLHETYRRLSYFPIIVGAVLFGVRGGMIMALTTSLAFIPHLHIFHEMDHEFYLSELTEIILYFIAGLVVGVIAARESRLRVKYQDLSEQLDKSYKRLHEETKLLIEVEEQLRASQKLSALGQLSASLAHEIKNPLASIRGTAEIFLDEFPKEHPKHEFAQILIKETTRLANTVDEVLRFSRKQTPTTAHKEPVQDILGRVTTLLDHKFRRKQITIHPEIDNDAAQLAIDSDRMTQVFINLLLNGIQAMGQHGHIHIRAEIKDATLRMEFQDDGPGVPPELQKTLFTPFVSNQANGTGLGLAISSKIMESFLGTLRYETSAEGGACFIVELPL